MRVAAWLLRAAKVAPILLASTVASPARADTVDLTVFMVMSQQENREIRQVVAGIFEQLGLKAQECAASRNAIHLCAITDREGTVPLTTRWDSTFERLAEGWSGAALPWRRVGTPAMGLGHRKAMALDCGTTVFLMRVFIPSDQGSILEIMASKHPWL